METIVEFCGIYSLIRVLIKQIRTLIGISSNQSLILVFILSIILEVWLKFQHFNSSDEIFLKIFHVFYLSFNMHLITLLFREFTDYEVFDDLDNGSFLIYWLSLIDKNVWKTGLLSILFQNLMNYYQLFKF
jgi:hypothetical protein